MKNKGKRAFPARKTRPSEWPLPAILENLAEGVVIGNSSGTIIAANVAAEAILGRDRATLLGRSLYDPRLRLVREDGTPWTRSTHPGLLALDSGKPQPAQMTVRLRADGARIWISLNCFPIDLPRAHGGRGVVCELSDISAARRAQSKVEAAERRRSEQALARLAHYDSLTGLPNRLLLTDRLTHAMSRASRAGTLLAVMVLDLDQFKEVNDTLGQAVGDQALTEAVKRLQSCLRAADTLGRLGADEFAVLLENLPDLEEASRVAQRLLGALSERAEIGGHEIYLSASIGVAVYPLDHHDAETLLRNANLAMQQAKREGQNTFQRFSHEMAARTEHHARLKLRLRRALEREELMLHFQPQVDFATGRVVGAEALLRWNDRERGPVAPADFIPVAEETGLIVPIGRWVLHESCRQCKTWLDLGYAMRVAVNLSPRQFRQKDLVKSIDAILRETGLPAQRLELELTETTIMHGTAQAIAGLHELNELGVQTSVDDFGTGYSSLAYLHRFPVHKLKIDQSFVRDVGSGRRDAAIVTTMISLAKQRELISVAEGVETEEQMLFLLANGCDAYQGFLFSPPRPAGDITRLLAAQAAARRAGAQAAMWSEPSFSASLPVPRLEKKR